MLQFEPDSSLADWLAQRDEPWEQLVTMGPTGFESYARIGGLPTGLPVSNPQKGCITSELTRMYHQ